MTLSATHTSVGALPHFWPLVHLVATVGMFGLIWFVQVVHYPGLKRVGGEDFESYMHAHQRRTTWVVAPLMLVEAGSALYLTWLFPDSTWVWWGMALVFVVWLSTAFLQVPCHRRLERQKDVGAIVRLIATNWVRTIAWSARVPVAAVIVGQVAA